jgi:GTP pyrophosphokinase
LRQLLDWQSDLKDAQEYLETIKDGLFDGDVYVFTPQGDVIFSGTRGTPIDLPTVSTLKWATTARAHG